MASRSMKNFGPLCLQCSSKRVTKRNNFLISGVLIAALVVAMGLFGVGCSSTPEPIKDVANSQNATPATPDEKNPLKEMPVDFGTLNAQNPDVYGWIYVPGTNINCPVVQHATDNSFYMNHDAAGQENPYGAIFSEKANVADFSSDAVSILYGHLTDSKEMFSALHSYADQSYLDAHPQFYVYAPNHVYSYTVVSAYLTDDIHLMRKYNFFQSYKDLAKFQKEALNPNSLNATVNASAQLDESSRMLVLSTCSPDDMGEKNRFLVCAVQTGDQAF